MTIICRAAMADAILDLSSKIVTRFGADAANVDFLHFGTMRTPHLGSNRHGISIYAHPATGIRDPDDLLVAYFGDLPVRFETIE